jgi:hypothetical protein
MNTGLGAAGDLDPSWKIISVPSDTPGFTAGSNAVIMAANGDWASSSSWPSKWIGVTADGNTAIPGGTYVYQLSFASASYISTSIEVYFLADDAVESVAVSDGSATIQTITTGSNGWGFSCFSSFTLSAFGPTTTTLTFTVSNSFGPGGLLVQFGEFSYIPGCPTPMPSNSPTGPSIAPTISPSSITTPCECNQYSRLLFNSLTNCTYIDGSFKPSFRPSGVPSVAVSTEQPSGIVADGGTPSFRSSLQPTVVSGELICDGTSFITFNAS